MSEKEMRELDVWIGTNIFDVPFNRDCVGISNSLPHYTTDRAAAMEVLEKCIEHTKHTVCTGKYGGEFCVFLGGQYGRPTTQKANTLPLAICLFAKKIYENQIQA